MKFSKILRRLKFKNIKPKFPCSECLVGPVCNEQPCDKLEFDNSKLLNIVIEHSCCPDCGCKQFYEGPCGGLSQNVQCAKCGHWFNMCLPMVFERIRLPSELRRLVVNG